MTTQPKSCQAAWQHMHQVSEQRAVRNFVQVLDMSDYVVESDLFPKPALEAYSRWNLEKDIIAADKKYFSNLRGGGQGDYREGMQRKIANVVDCLTRFPHSKRATITVCNEPIPDHSNDDHAKCLRELHLHLDDSGLLSGTVLFRAQAAMLFPKNIHFIGSIMADVAKQLPQKPALGTLFYLATILVSDRT